MCPASRRPHAPTAPRHYKSTTTQHDSAFLADFPAKKRLRDRRETRPSLTRLLLRRRRVRVGGLCSRGAFTANGRIRGHPTHTLDGNAGMSEPSLVLAERTAYCLMRSRGTRDAINSQLPEQPVARLGEPRKRRSMVERKDEARDIRYLARYKLGTRRRVFSQ